jgi:RHS repeat-associated protein
VDAAGEVPAVLLVLDANNNNAILKTYINANSQTLAQHDGDHAASRYFYLHDRLGSVRMVFDANGAVVNYYTYDPWGLPVVGEASSETISNLYRFAGYAYDSENRMYYCVNRMYDPVLGRFTSRDPVDGKFEEPMTLHKYLYCTNDPINFVDPQGLWEIETHRSFGRFGYGPGKKVMISGGSSDPTDAPRFFEYGPAPFDYGSLDIDFPPWTVSPPWTEFTSYHFMSRREILPQLTDSIQRSDRQFFGWFMHAWQDSYVHYDRFGKNAGKHIGTTADNPLDPWNVEHNCYNRTELTTLIWEDMYIKSNMATAIEEGWVPSDYTPSSPWLSIGEDIVSY